MRVVVALLVLGIAILMGQDSPPPPDWREWIKKGTESFRWARYPEAVSAFQKASDANPDSPVPHLYLALGWFQEYIPGAVSADNSDCARHAETELRRALALDPKSWTAIVMLGQLTFYEGRPDEARQWYRKALDVEPQNSGIWCTLGTIDWQQWLRQGKPAHAPTLDEAILNFEKSVAVDPVHEVGMRHLSQALRERAGTRAGDEEKRQDVAAADRWLEKAADARSENVQAAIARISRSPEIGDPDAMLKQWALMAVTPPPPPPPPPPPALAKGRQASGAPARAGAISWEPMVRMADEAPPVRIVSAVQAQKLIAKVEPEYPAGASFEGPLRFVVVIGKDGHIVGETSISGIPWLVSIAREALHRWVCQPTLVNGTQVEVVTEVRAEFKFGQ